MNPVIVEEWINAPAAQVWSALTDLDKLHQWYFAVSGFRPEVGFAFQFPGQGNKGEKYMHHCKVLAVVPNEKLQYSWEYENIAGYSIVTFELREVGGRTLVRLTHEGLESFPSNSPDFARESFHGGWTHIITQSLVGFLAKAAS